MLFWNWLKNAFVSFCRTRPVPLQMNLGILAESQRTVQKGSTLHQRQSESNRIVSRDETGSWVPAGTQGVG